MEKEISRKARWGCALVIVVCALMYLAGYGLYALIAL